MKSQTVINDIIRSCQVNQVAEDELNEALLSLLCSSMRAGFRDEHTLCNDDGELIMLVKLYV